MVWLAPVPRSSGGLSAVITIRGTRSLLASMMAGRKFAAAVPDVHASRAGRPVARRESERKEGSGALVDADVKVDALLVREGQGEGSRARAGSEHGVGDAVAHELVGQSRRP